MSALGEERVVRTVCGIEDGTRCGILAHVRNGVLVKVEPADFPDRRFRHVCAKALCSPKLVYHPDRLKYPLRRVGERGEGRWQRISWDEATDIIVSKLREIGEKHGYESIAFVVEKLAYLRLASALETTMVNPIGFGDTAGPCGDEIKDRGLKFNWKAFSRVDTVNPEVMLKLKEAGCTYLCYGVESGNQQILDTVKKKTTLEKAREGVKMAKDAGISVQAAFILGLPGETKETLIQTMQFAQELDTFYGLHVLAPFPGTEVREKAEEYGIEILTNDWYKYDANRPVTRTKGASPEDIIAALHRYYIGLRLTPDRLAGVESGQAEAEKSKRRSPFPWALLRGDVIENLGMMELKGNPVEDLASRLAEIVRYPCHQVSESIKRWMSAGLLKYEVQSKHLVWRWS